MRNTRYMVTVDQETASLLNLISKKQSKSISGIIMELIDESLDLREDLYWSRIAEEAEERAEGKPTIPAEEVWKKCGLQ